MNKMDKYTSGSTSTPAPAHILDAVKTALPTLDASQVFCISCLEAEKSNSDSENGTSDPGNLQWFLTGLLETFKSMTTPLAPEVDPDAMEDTSEPTMWQESLGATERQRILLEECAEHLSRFLQQVDVNAVSAPSAVPVDELEGHEEGIDIVMAAESLRAAAECLAKITGRGDAGDVEEVLGVVFEK